MMLFSNSNSTVKELQLQMRMRTKMSIVIMKSFHAMKPKLTRMLSSRQGSAAQSSETVSSQTEMLHFCSNEVHFFYL